MELTINVSRSELPRMNMMIEQQVDLAKRPTLRLRKSEPAPDVAEQVGPCVEESRFGSPIPS